MATDEAYCNSYSSPDDNGDNLSHRQVGGRLDAIDGKSTDSLAVIVSRSETLLDAQDSVTGLELMRDTDYQQYVAAATDSSATSESIVLSAGRNHQGGSSENKRSRLSIVNHSFTKTIHKLPSLVSNSFPRINYTRLPNVPSHKPSCQSLPNLAADNNNVTRKPKTSKKVTWTELSTVVGSCQDPAIIAGIHMQSGDTEGSQSGKKTGRVSVIAEECDHERPPASRSPPLSQPHRVLFAKPMKVASKILPDGIFTCQKENSSAAGGDGNNMGLKLTEPQAPPAGEATNNTKWKKAKNVFRSIIAAGCGCWQTQRSKPEDWEVLQEIGEVSSSSSEEIADFQALKRQSTSVMNSLDVSIDLDDGDDELMVATSETEHRRRLIPVGSLAFNTQSTPSYSGISDETTSVEKLFIDGIIELNIND